MVMGKRATRLTPGSKVHKARESSPDIFEGIIEDFVYYIGRRKGLTC